MIVLAALLALAAACLLGAPRLLRLRRAAIRRPRLLLAVWLGVFLTGAAAVGSSVLWSVMLAVADRPGPLDAGWVAGVLAWGALAVTGAVAALVLTRAEPLLSGRSATSRDLDLLAAACADRVERLRGVQVLFVRADRPVAFSSTCDGGRIVVTTALAEGLAPGELRAVLEHERAHLAGRHDVLLRVARVNRACLPALFGARAFDQAVHLLVELAADDAAARACGPATVAAALRRAAELEANEWAEIRAARLEAARPRTRAVGIGALYKL
ncbi:M48 family metalloprotease [Amnibacterium kyonggiense]|uniref:Zn-dependent protease with chaperone function n=1 Tax=Amnibacterium kyonggiense TaxID=595671 RepID=A0A4R7FRQ0_9MICO|nr:M48 family metalloprotease [Amnibacterium kyonggiense]TDS80483.1 Zn-dependent protease with chaperone function [Amnibacterium kyonggiense]